MNAYQRFIYITRYARYLPDKKRREYWKETVQRYVDFFKARSKVYPADLIFKSIHDMEVMPSMRALMTAGPALDRDNVAGFNCSFVPIDHPRSFDEILFCLMCGTGVGFSVESKHLSKLPEVSEEMFPTDTTIIVSDSKIGWAKSLRELIGLLFQGQIPKWDVNLLRPAGAPLKTFGGRASGPQPLVDMFEFVTSVFRRAAGRKLTSLECHDIICKIADCVVVGGVRRSALISLSDLHDDAMRTAKSGQWWTTDSQRALANNSSVFEDKPTMEVFMREWLALYQSKSGERGMFNRQAMRAQATAAGRDPEYDFGINPCVEVILRPYEFCNLSEVVIRPGDTLDDLLRKVEIATIIGTYQSTLTNFRYLRKIWKHNCEEERLLGVSLTGICDHPVFGRADHKLLPNWLGKMKERAIEVNKAWAKRLGVPPSASITCVKPSGTVSQLVGCSSGIHPAFSDYYVRTVRSDRKDPIGAFMKSKGVPCEPDVSKPDHTDVFSFPIKAPAGSRVSGEMNALEQLELYLIYQRNWCQHNASTTIYVREHEWFDVGAWVYKHFDEIGGVSFLPYSDHVYKQAPYTPVEENEYHLLVNTMPQIPWDEVPPEESDQTTHAKSLACSGGTCEI